MSRKRKSYEAGHQRSLLVVIDDTPECDRAVYYAAKRAMRTAGRLVMLAVVSPGESNQQWLGVGDLMLEEAREEAQRRLDHYASRARNLAGVEPVKVMREGVAGDEILKIIDEDEDIAVLVLAAGTGKEGPGPLVSSLTGANTSNFPVPITVVPGHLSDEELDAVA